jgi:hypothetical protein
MTGYLAGWIDRVRRQVAAVVLCGALAAIALILVAMCIAAAIVFALLAVYLHLSAQLTPAAAALATGGVAVLIAILIAGIGYLAVRIASRPRRSLEAVGRDDASPRAVGGALDAAADDASRWITKNPGTAIVSAFAAGTVFGLSPQLRRAVVDLIVAAIRSPPRDP